MLESILYPPRVLFIKDQKIGQAIFGVGAEPRSIILAAMEDYAKRRARTRRAPAMASWQLRHFHFNCFWPGLLGFRQADMQLSILKLRRDLGFIDYIG